MNYCEKSKQEEKWLVLCDFCRTVMREGISDKAKHICGKCVEKKLRELNKYRETKGEV